MKIGAHDISIKNRSGFIIPLIYWTVTIAYLIESRHLLNDNSMLLVKIVAIVMAVYTGLIIKGNLNICKTEDKPEKQKEESPLASLMNAESMKMIVFVLLITLYLIAIPFIGFLLSTVIVMAVLMLFLGIRDWKIFLPIPVVLTTLIWLMFDMWLKISLPVGIFGF